MTSKSLTGKRILYTLCFVGFCIIDQIKGSATGRVQMTAVNCMGFLMAAIILSAYHWKDFLKLPYYIWTGIFVVGGVAAYLWGKTNYPYQGRWITAILNVGIYGYILIRLWYKFVVDKEKLQVNKVLFAIWCIMLLCMLFSRNEAIWPLWFLVMFGSFYVTDYRPEVRKVLFDSMIDGLIVGFFLIQGAAFLFRPFDLVRYMGMYANPNINALFYVVVYGAWLSKWYSLKKDNSSIIRRGTVAFFASAMFGFIFLTMSKDALLTAGIMTIFFLVSCCYIRRGMIRKIWITAISIAFIAVVSFPLVFGCVRYVPAIVHHPVWFEGEYNEYKVQSWDPIDSEKYVDWDEFMSISFGRVLWFIDFTKEEVRGFNKTLLTVQAKEYFADGDEVVSSNNSEIDVDDGDGKHPALTKQEDIDNPFTVRKTIHEYYLHRLNLLGHSSSQNGFWITEDSYAPHAHNIFLQLAFDFGIMPAVLFLFMGSCAVCSSIKNSKMRRGREVDKLFAIGIFTIALFVFGIYEIDWEIGQLSLVIYYICMNAIMRKYETFYTADC